MKIPPAVLQVQGWLISNNPLGLFDGNFEIKDIDPKPWSGHFNYLLTTGEKKLILRFKGPEWGTPGGVDTEYLVLQKVEPYAVAPAPIFKIQNFFGEVAILEEYLEGETLDHLPATTQSGLFSEVARTVRRINSIPFDRNEPYFRGPLLDYERSKKSWRERIDFISLHPAGREVGAELDKLYPAMCAVLDKFEPLLISVIAESGPKFIFESSHLGHCLATPRGIRFINWEQVSYGDPTYTLAVFLVSILKRDDFSSLRREMLGSYFKENPEPDWFDELLEQRITERRIANAIWLPYAGLKKGETESAAWQEGIAIIREVLAETTS